MDCASRLATCIDENAATARASVNPLLRILWRAKSCSAKDQKCAAVETALPLGANRGIPRSHVRGLRQTRGDLA
jgi:hypothetical protein